MTEPTASTAELRSGEVVELTVGEIAHGGVCVARHESGRVVFVPDVLPGERVRARITEVKKRFARAETLEVLEEAPERRPHIWAAASLERAPEERAGGAEFGHMLPADGRELKRRVLVDALARFGGIERDVDVEALLGDDASRGTHWRTRLTLHVDADGRVGPYAARSHRIVSVDDLPLAFDDIEELALRTIGEGVGAGPGRIEFVAPAEYDSRRRILLDGASAPESDTVTERVGDLEFTVDQGGFWQIHRHAARTLFDAVAEFAGEGLDPEARNLDLYGGVGLFAAALATVGGEFTDVESVEASAAATGHAAANLGRWRRASASTARVDRYLRRLIDTADAAARARMRAATVVLDPPRAGAGAEVVNSLGAVAPQRLVYVACDPVALARDTGLLRDAGFELGRLRALDLFPNTHHLETVAEFVRAD